MIFGRFVLKPVNLESKVGINHRYRMGIPTKATYSISTQVLDPRVRTRSLAHRLLKVPGSSPKKGNPLKHIYYCDGNLASAVTFSSAVIDHLAKES